jgi:hypothetical protein
VIEILPLQRLNCRTVASLAGRWIAGVAVAFAAATSAAHAFTATLTAAAPKTIYLQIGAGTFTGGNFSAGGTGANNATVNTVSLSLPSAVVGNGVAQTMTTNSTTANSFYDGFAFCNLPNQLYIGGYYRKSGAATAAAQVVANVPLNLVSSSGRTIPMSQIRWTSGGNGDGAAAQPFPAGTFTGGGVQNVGSIASNQWAESCWTFSYLNAAVRPGGGYTATVTYTVTTP